MDQLKRCHYASHGLHLNYRGKKMLSHMISDTLRLIDKDIQISVKDGIQPSIISPKTLFKTSVPTDFMIVHTHKLIL